MKKKKVLMWMSVSNLKPIGGPSGYLYNIYDYVNKTDEITNIDFLPPSKNKPNFISKVISFLVQNFSLIRFWSLKTHLLKKNNFLFDIDLSCYDIIHFHDTISLFMARDLIDNFNGLILLTSHSPQPLHLEYMENECSSFTTNQTKTLINILELIDKFSFLRADYVMFPCEEAKDPYKKWSFFDKTINIKEDKFFYCPTGTKDFFMVDNRDKIRRKYNIGNKDFLISYVGRHNLIKGYDNLKIIGKKILNQHNNVYFIVAGKEGPIKRLNHKRWIEVGYTNDPHSLINASDLFILPNKQTFFDLILLEVLSIGTKIMATYTGGNKFFKKFENINLIYYKNTNDAIRKINSLITDESSYDKKINREIFKTNFTTSKFLLNYNNVINTLK